MIKVILTAAALLAAPAALAQASDWRSLGKYGGDQEGVSAFVDGGTMTRPTPTMREYTIASHFAVVRTFKSSGKRYTMIRSRYRVDCSAMTVQTVHIAAFDGEQEILSTDQAGDVTAIKPNTIAGETAPLACGAGFGSLPRITAATPNLEGKRIYGQ